MILSGKNWSFKKSQKLTLSKGVNPWILYKNRNFSYGCFSQKLCQKRSFFDILDRKQSFWDQKMEVLTRAKKFTFLKGVSPWILSKNGTFSYRRFSQKLCPKRSFLDILNRKTIILRPKNWSFNKGQKVDNF